jgi:protein-S-isoprenylcysteine O-methyltransferase Ste14
MLALAYGAIAYVMFLGTLVYAIGFVGGIEVPKTIDSGAIGSIRNAIAIDLGLLGLFAVQHSVMARPTFKRWWTRIVPPVAERSTYVFASNLLLLLIFWQWRPMPTLIWNVEQPIVAASLWALSGLGWLIALVSTFLINHFDLFGLRQVYLHFSGQPYTAIPFSAPWLYRMVRHPLVLGFLIAFWATPRMSWGHLLFAEVVTAYVLVALRLEERDLLAYHGESYSAYQRQVRMLVPIPGRRQNQME